MTNHVFEIKNVACAYSDGRIVLKIKELNIPRGGITILLGISGSGKSTLLETLGLMTNTLVIGSEIKFNAPFEKYEFHHVWEQKEKYIASVRNRYFSFIFQNTNLMPGFTAYENVVVTQLLQGKSMKESLEKVKRYMQIMGLEEVGPEKKAQELAGGQKQRLAFVRAITPDFDVLFADEPTGNLDRKNARELMQQLKNQVTEQNKTAVIVTHDILLAEEFADQIVVISKPDGTGIIENTHVFTRSKVQWVDFQQNEINIRLILKKLLGIYE